MLQDGSFRNNSHVALLPSGTTHDPGQTDELDGSSLDLIGPGGGIAGREGPVIY